MKVVKFLAGKARHFNNASKIRLTVAIGSLANSSHLSLVFNLQVEVLYSNSMRLVRDEVQELFKSDSFIPLP